MHSCKISTSSSNQNYHRATLQKPTCVHKRPNPRSLRQGGPSAERGMRTGKDESLRKALYHSAGHHAEGAHIVGHDWDEQREHRTDGHGPHQHPSGAVFFRQQTGHHLGYHVAPEERGEDGAIVGPVVGLELS